jgi:hypothetical protein
MSGGSLEPIEDGEDDADGLEPNLPAEQLSEAGELVEPGPDTELEQPAWSESGGLAIPYTELAAPAELESAELGAERAAGSPTAIAWRENPANLEPERYLDDAGARAQLRQALKVGGFNDRALALINPPGGRYALQRAQNCGECARAVASVLNGEGRPACPLLPRHLEDGSVEFGEESSTMELALGRAGEYDRNFAGRRMARLYEVEHDRVDEAVRRQFDALEAELLRDGNGSHATVALIWKPFEDDPSGYSSGHWLNAVNVDGKIVYIDGQRAERGERDSSFMRRYQQDAMGISWIRADRDHD